MKVGDVRKKFLEFYAKRGHALIPSASLVPDNDPTTLFTGSGMQPLVPYLLGAKHPSGVRVSNSQKSFRSVDIDEVGDNRHTTFFEMLGNWSFGNYFKKEQLPWVFEFFTKEIGIDPSKLYVTVFAGDADMGIPRDTESASIWQDIFSRSDVDAKTVEIGSEDAGGKIGMQGGRIFYYDSAKNWWSRSGAPENMPAGEPGGPDSEIFYEFSDVKHDEKYGENCHPNCDCGRYLEIGNSVFMEYQKQADGRFAKLKQRNVDFGGGLERIAMASQDRKDIFSIDVFRDFISTVEEKSGKKYDDEKYTAAFRILADHIRSAVFLISDGVLPSNTERGYFVRRLLRRAVRYWDKLEIGEFDISDTVSMFADEYRDAYPEIARNCMNISAVIKDEVVKFRHTLKQGLKEFEKLLSKGRQISGKDAFALFSSYGFPVELTDEIAKERNASVDMGAYTIEFEKHKELSRSGSEKKFKGGLGDSSEQTVRYHTATHLLHAGLRAVLGEHVIQKGSNITADRLRFDFLHPTKMTPLEKKQVEDFVNSAISKAMPVSKREMPKDEALAYGALHAFNEKYGDTVTVYTVGDGQTSVVSKEFCGGPHVSNTKELSGPDGAWKFEIEKEEAVSAGVRRVKAVLK